MQGIYAVRQLADSSGRSRRALSVELGKTPNYLSSLIGQGCSPTTETLAQLCNALGYRLAIVKADSLPDDSMIIDG